jgi:murein L,D-transpeptidase YcbB/YkuD
LDALAARLEALGEGGLDPRHYDLWDAALARAIPVRLHYDTEIVEEDVVVMRRDVYGLDAACLRALDAPRSQRLAEASPRP